MNNVFREMPALLPVVVKEETVAQQAYRLLKEVPSGEWMTGMFTNGSNKCCAMGHYVRLRSGNPDDYRRDNCCDFFIYGSFGSDLRRVSFKFFNLHHGRMLNIADVNNGGKTSMYTQDKPKARVMALLEDMIKAGY